MRPTNTPSLRPIKSVTEINAEIRQRLESDYRFVRIRGEISNARKPYSGHCYFVLKDTHAQLNAVMFKNQQRWLSKKLTDGQEVICDGRISVYEPRGQYQLIVDSVDFDGTGQLRILFEQLKARLKAEGLFAPSGKSPLPQTINHIVVITSPTGAAIHDFLSICRKRNSRALVQILPVRVQGRESIREICDAIETAETLAPDVIVLCRGGGSIEDLWSFNEEELARTIHRSSIPIVTGIGHETDFTIADFCADIRCPTPTGAAELLIADTQSLTEAVVQLHARLLMTMSHQLDDYEARLDTSARLLGTFDDAFSSHSFRLDHLSTRLQRTMSDRILTVDRDLAELEGRLRGASPVYDIRSYEDRLELLFNKLTSHCRRLHESKRTRFLRSAAVLDTLSPLKTLARGYGIVSFNEKSRPKRGVITSAREVRVNDSIDIRLHSGELECSVVAKRIPE